MLQSFVHQCTIATVHPVLTAIEDASALVTTDSDTRVFNRASLQDAASIDSELVPPADTWIDTQERGVGIAAFVCSLHAHRASHTHRFSV